jgi:hypothetical protein
MATRSATPSARFHVLAAAVRRRVDCSRGATMQTAIRFGVLIPLALVGCADMADPCDEMSAKLAACFPEVTTIAPTCDPEIADVVNSATCDELSARDGKADGWSCVWMPWLPSCGSGGSSSGKRIEVSTEECGPGALCPYVTGASCGLVTLHQGSQEVARGFSSGGGRFTFDGLAAGEYTVKVHERGNRLARMFVSDFSDETASASVKVTVGSGDAPWARFNLVNGSAAAMTRCADLDGSLSVKAKSNSRAVDRRLVEWDWIVELETDGAVVDRTRPLFIHHEASGSGQDENALGFRQLRAGTHTLRFVRMDIPTYKQKPNPDYADLVKYYRADDVEPIEVTVTVSATQASGRTISIDRALVDPLR